jgi:hypothetical protein
VTDAVLEQLRDLFSTEGTWIAHGTLSPYHLSQAEDGDWVRPDSPRAVRWTLEGAIIKLCGVEMVDFAPLVVWQDQTPTRRLLSKLVSDRLMAVNYREDGPCDLRAHSDEGGSEGTLALIDKAMALSPDDVTAASERVRKIDPVVGEPVLPEPEPPAPMPDVVWEQAMGKRLPSGDWELVVPFDGDYRVQPQIWAINGRDLETYPSDGLYQLTADDVLTTDDVGHLHMIEEREPREVGRWFRYERDRKLGVRLTELISENARDRQ